MLCRGTGAKTGARMSQAQSFYDGHSFYEGLTWWFVRERIGQGLRERYRVPKDLKTAGG
jgi:hypothetical protein